MKKLFKKFAALIIAVLVISMMSVSAFAAGFDFNSAIAGFEETAFNTSDLKVGATDKPQAYVWLQNGGNIYTSDASVVTVAADGTVTAVGSGTAYVAIVASTGMSELYRYDVAAAKPPVASEPVYSEPTVSVPTIGATDPDANVSSDNNSTTSSSNANNSSSSGYDEDEYSSIKSDWEEQDEKIKDKHKEIEEKAEKIMSFSFGMFKGVGIFIIVIFVLVFAIGIGGAIFVYRDAGKNGMPRIWCLAPLFLFIIGLIIYLAVRSMNKTNGTSATHTLICPTCNCVHPIGTEECSICGRKLK